MYRQRDIPYRPKKISRKEFVRNIFDIGNFYQYNYDTLITAVHIGDKFINFNKDRIPYKKYGKRIRDFLTNKEKRMLRKLVPQKYSVELAHVCLSISSSVLEDHGYYIETVASELENGFVYKMQWEICMTLNFQLVNNNIITAISSILGSDGNLPLNSIFWDISRSICMKRNLIEINPITILLAIIILYKNNRLRVVRKHKERLFKELMLKVSHEYEIPISYLLKQYIKIKSEK